MRGIGVEDWSREVILKSRSLTLSLKAEDCLNDMSEGDLKDIIAGK